MFRRSDIFVAVIVGLLGFAPASLAAPAAPQTMSAGDVLRGQFVQTRQLQGFAKPLKSEGSFVLVPGRGLIWHSEKPFDNTAIITAGGILQLAKGREAMRLSAAKLPGLAQLYNVLSAALSGNTGPLQQTFAVTQTSGNDGWKVELKPLDSGKQAMSQIKRLVLSGTRYVDAVEVERTGGDVDRITFSGHKVAKADLTPGEVAQLKAAAK
jgi:hypothetical protein